MKKLLLVALLAMGATSFAAVEGTPTKVSLPIIAKAEVITGTPNLIIESTTAGMSGDEMAFDFGKVVANGKDSEVLQGTFKIARGDNSAILDGTTYNTIKVGLDETGTAQDATSTINRGQDITFKYALSFVAPATNATEATGSISAKVNVTTGATAGQVTDNSKNVYVVVSKS